MSDGTLMPDKRGYGNHDLVGTRWRTTGWIGGHGLIEVVRVRHSAITDRVFRAVCVTEDGREVEYPVSRRGRLQSCRRASNGTR